MGKTTKAFIFLGGLLVLLIGGRMIVSLTHTPDDKALIVQALKDSIQASKEGRPGGVMDKLSSNLTLNGENESGNQTAIARYIRKSKPDVTVEDITPVVTGDQATIVSPVDLSISLLGVTQSRRIKQVTMIFHKEDDRDWLIFPTRKWKLAEVQVPEDAINDLAQP